MFSNLKLQILTPKGYEWITWCKTRLTILTENRKKIGSHISKKIYSLPDNLIAQIISSDTFNIIRIIPQENAFTCHIRTDQKLTGVQPDGSSVKSDLFDFPLIDNDHGTWLVAPSADTNVIWTAEAAEIDVENYGNISWIDSDNENIMTWRGWPSYTISPYSRTVSSSGLTIVDEAQLEKTYLTPQTNKLYSQGIITELPGLIRGVAILNDLTVAVVRRNYNNYDITGFANPLPNPRGTLGGYFDILYISGGEENISFIANGVSRLPETDGWRMIDFRESTIFNMPVWFSQDGYTGYDEDGIWTWSVEKHDGIDIFASSFTHVVEPIHQYTVTPLPAWRVVGEGVWSSNFMQNVSAEITYSINDSTSLKATQEKEYGYFPTLYTDRGAPAGIYLDIASIGPGLYSIGLGSIKAPPATYSTSCGELTSTEGGNTLDVTNCCGVVTVTGTDGCGYSASASVPGYSGDWVLVSSTIEPGFYHGYDGHWETTYESNGTVKRMRWWTDSIKDSGTTDIPGPGFPPDDPNIDCSYGHGGGGCSHGDMPWVALRNESTVEVWSWCEGAGGTPHVNYAHVDCPVAEICYAEYVYSWEC